MPQDSALALAGRAATQVQALPPLLVEAERIAATVILGEHGRKRAGPGESFWQYRPYSFGDSTQRIDWHKSARSDRVFIRENEWEAANTLWLWASPAVSMSFRSHLARVSKLERARLLALALASLALRAQERVGAFGAPFAPDHARAQLVRLADWMVGAAGGAGLPAPQRLPRFASAVLIGDFLDPVSTIAEALAPIAEAGVKGHVVQIADPAEETLPYEGRTEFHDMTGPVTFLSARAETLRGAYAERLAAHRADLAGLCRRLGWSFLVHRTDQAPAPALLALHALISGEGTR